MFKDYTFEREEKLKTLLTDCVDIEVSKTINCIQKLFTDDALWNKWLFALDFAKRQNYGSREIDKYYITHPLRLCRFLASTLDPKGNHFYDSLIAAVLHNAIEKKILNFNQISMIYSPWIAVAVETITVNRDQMKTQSGVRTYYEAIQASCIEIQTIKIFDKIDNLFAVCLCSDDAMRETYLEEVEVYVRPIVHNIYPNLLIYLDGLIVDNRKIGFYKKKLS